MPDSLCLRLALTHLPLRSAGKAEGRGRPAAAHRLAADRTPRIAAGILVPGRRWQVAMAEAFWTAEPAGARLLIRGARLAALERWRR